MNESRSKFIHDPVTGQRRKKARYEVQYVRRSSRTASKAAPQYGEDSGNPSSDTNTDEYRKSSNESGEESVDSESENEYDDEQEEEIEDEQVPPEFQPPQTGQPVPPEQFGPLKIRRPNMVPEFIPRVNYRRGKGATRRTMTERQKDPRRMKKITYDYRFHTMFHLDFYSSVILSRKSVVIPSQWIDWQHARNLQKSSIQSAIEACERIGAYDIMQFRHDWCKEIIAQFYATLFVEKNTKRMHWMTEGNWHSVDYRTFAAHLGFGDGDLKRHKIHHDQILPAEQLAYMYPPSSGEVEIGKVGGIHPTYGYLNRMFRVSIDCKTGGRETISDYSKNMLYRMASDTQPFSVFDFIWHEIKRGGERPIKGCGYAPFIMHMIEQVTGHTFTYDESHKPLRIQADLIEVPGPIPSVSTPADALLGDARAAASSPPRALSRSTSRRGSSPSRLHEDSSYIFGMCKDMNAIKAKLHHERKARRKDTRTLKQLAAHFKLQPPRSPPSEDTSSEPEIFDQQLVRYKREYAEYRQSGFRSPSASQSGDEDDGIDQGADSEE